jgi:hypothetical protein
LRKDQLTPYLPVEPVQPVPMKQPVQTQIENPSTRHDVAQGEGGAAQGEAQARAGVGVNVRPQGEGGAAQGEAQARCRARCRRGLEWEPTRMA